MKMYESVKLGVKEEIHIEKKFIIFLDCKKSLLLYNLNDLLNQYFL
jgi:hypothetical protein